MKIEFEFHECFCSHIISALFSLLFPQLNDTNQRIIGIIHHILDQLLHYNKHMPTLYPLFTLDYFDFMGSQKIFKDITQTTQRISIINVSVFILVLTLQSGNNNILL